MSSGGRPQRQSQQSRSSVLDAIFDMVEQDDAPTPAAGMDASPFRASALAALDAPAEVDRLVALTSRRSWVALVGVAVAIAAFLLYAATTTQVDAVTATGRVVGPTGVGVAASPAQGTIDTLVVAEQEQVGAGQVLATGMSDDGEPFTVSAPVAGNVWQALVLDGGVVDRGSAIATVLPTGSEHSTLVSMDENVAAAVAGAQQVIVSTASTTTPATVGVIASAPLPAATAAQRTALPAASGLPQTLVSLTVEEPLPPGAEVTVRFVLSERTLLQRMFGAA